MMNITALPQFTRNANRFKQIVWILGKYGLAYWIKDIFPGFIKGLFKSSQGERISDMTFEARVRMALTELGPTFIKLGQILSTRPDLVGPVLAQELTELQSDTPADPPDAVRAVIESELGKKIEELFTEFDEQAIASASIGQAHIARLRTGQAVVVKVQHRGIENKIATDLDILAVLADLGEKYDDQLRLYQPKAIVAEFSRILLHELDFRREERNLQRFSQNFAQDASIHIPIPFPELSSRRVLTMEKLQGFSIGDREKLKQEGLDTQEIAQRGANLFLDMIFRDRFYHADPHPGNIWILPDRRFGLLDCGMVGHVDDLTVEILEEILLAAVETDAQRITDLVVRMGTIPRGFDRSALQNEISEFVADFAGQSLGEFDLTGALNGVTDIIRRYRILLPKGIALLIKVLVMLEGTSRLLNRDFNLAELLEPYYKKAAQRRFTPEKILSKLKRSYRDWDRLIDLFPREAADILQRMRDGRFDVQLEHHRLDSTVNRLVLGILVAALLLSSCMLVSRQIPPSLLGISIPGAAGVFLSIYLGYRLYRAIKRSGDLGDR
jgi:ubiquinone biosynthesis protein